LRGAGWHYQGGSAFSPEGVGRCAGGSWKDVHGRQELQQAAEDLVDDLYAYQTGQVLFKPTKAADIKFRMTKAGALSYFIGDNKDFPEDKGFALEPWTNVRFENAGIYINGDVAVAMGKYFFTPLKGDIVKVEYTFGYVEDDGGNPKIFLHHSSLPYPNK